ncbi:hypothetical protein LJC11_03005 [Bacteroidales bacterium OttesenSCG-928-I21]|nr:hypothetical protein [Bacteroidales bacterium OttesenSCG-928-I21]
MEKQGKDINIIFKPQIGLGNILFSFQENDIIKMLGTPDERKIDVFNLSESAIYLYYDEIKIHLSIYYENGKFDHLSIGTEDIVLDSVRFSSSTKDEIIKFIANYHYKNKIHYLCEYTYAENINEEEYFFENIGLTIWFEENTISDICVQKSDNVS